MSLTEQRKKFSQNLSHVEIKTKREGNITQVFNQGMLVFTFKRTQKTPSTSYLGFNTRVSTLFFKEKNREIWRKLVSEMEVPSDLRVWYEDQAFQVLQESKASEFSSPKDIKEFSKMISLFLVEAAQK